MKVAKSIIATMARRIAAAAFVIAAASCERFPVPDGRIDHVFVVYMDGFNNLPTYMRDNQKDLFAYAPRRDHGGRYRLLVYSHFTAKANDYSTLTCPVLEDVYLDRYGTLVRDTVEVFPEGYNSASTDAVRQVLSFVKDNYPADSYGLLYSSHGTGWLPREYYDHPDYYGDRSHEQEIIWGGLTAPDDAPPLPSSACPRREASQGPAPVHPLFLDPETKSLGCTAYYDNKQTLHTHEIELPDIASMVPEGMHLKYILLDACLMGGIETVWELRNKTDFVVASQCEVPAKGFMYRNLPARLFRSSADLNGICDDYLEDNRDNATLSVIDCSALDGFATVCSSLFEKYRDSIQAVNPSSVQHYFRFDKQWFYDMAHIITMAGASPEDLQIFETALRQVVRYKVASSSFMGIHINHHCGLSMFLPAGGTDFLRSYYKDLQWNKATNLVK